MFYTHGTAIDGMINTMLLLDPRMIAVQTRRYGRGNSRFYTAIDVLWARRTVVSAQVPHQ